jgi:hypothetical protein
MLKLVNESMMRSGTFIESQYFLTNYLLIVKEKNNFIIEKLADTTLHK